MRVLKLWLRLLLCPPTMLPSLPCHSSLRASSASASPSHFLLASLNALAAPMSTPMGIIASHVFILDLIAPMAMTSSRMMLLPLPAAPSITSPVTPAAPVLCRWPTPPTIALTSPSFMGALLVVT